MSDTRPRARNVRKLLARLNPKGMRLGGTGGVPLETAIDIAGAVGLSSGGFDPARLAALVLCLRWWPAMFEGPARAVAHRVIHHEPELHDRLEDAKREKLVAGCCERIPIEAPSETPAFQQLAGLIAACLRRRIQRDRQLADEAVIAEIRARLHGAPVPRPRRGFAAPLEDGLAARVLSRDFLATWARAVIAEYRNPNHCPSCQPFGRVGEVPAMRRNDAGVIVKVEWVACEPCLGQGVTAWSSHRRARALGIGNHPFRQWLKPHHDGALSLLRTLEDRGARRLLARLSDER